MTDIFAWEPIADLLRDGVKDIARIHWEEVGVHKDDMPLVVDWEKYQQLEDIGLIKWMSVRRDGTLIGYSSYVILPHLHYAATLHAMNDAIFMGHDYRGVGIRLIMEAERALAQIATERGYPMVRIIYHAKTDVAKERGTFSRVFEQLGYMEYEKSHDKIVKNNEVK